MWAWFPRRSPSLAVSRGWPGHAVWGAEAGLPCGAVLSLVWWRTWGCPRSLAVFRWCAAGEILGDQSQVCAGGQAEVQLVGNLRKIDHLSRFGACGVDPDPDDSCSHDRHVAAAGGVHNQVYRYEI